MTDIIKRLRKIGVSYAQASPAQHNQLEAADEIERLRAELDNIKQVEFQRRVEKVAEGWRGKCDRLEKERDALRAKIAQMEKQEPVEWQTRTRPAWNDGTWGPWRRCSEEYAEDIKKTPLLHDWLYEARALYALPGAKGE